MKPVPVCVIESERGRKGVLMMYDIQPTLANEIRTAREDYHSLNKKYKALKERFYRYLPGDGGKKMMALYRIATDENLNLDKRYAAARDMRRLREPEIPEDIKIILTRTKSRRKKAVQC